MSYEILPDLSDRVAEWVCRGLGFINVWRGNNLTYGFVYNGKLIGGLIFHDLQRHKEVWWTLYSTDRHWCNRRMLRQVFTMAFVTMDCRRINILVNKSNRRSFDFVRRLGFVQEGLLRKYDDNGEDCYFLGMLREECPWLNIQKGEHK